MKKMKTLVLALLYVLVPYSRVLLFKGLSGDIKLSGVSPDLGDFEIRIVNG